VSRVLGPGGMAHIDHVACGAGIFGKRPLLRRVAKAAGVPARLALCVGDELRDADAAAALDMDFIGVSWGYATEAVLASRSVRAPLRTFADLLDAV